MSHFRKKPVVIEAVQWTGDNQQEIHDFAAPRVRFEGSTRDGWDLVITTLEGPFRPGVGWWVIKGVRGEFYACKADIFEATYDAVADHDPGLAAAVPRAQFKPEGDTT